MLRPPHTLQMLLQHEATHHLAMHQAVGYPFVDQALVLNQFCRPRALASAKANTPCKSRGAIEPRTGCFFQQGGVEPSQSKTPKPCSVPFLSVSTDWGLKVERSTGIRSPRRSDSSLESCPETCILLIPLIGFQSQEVPFCVLISHQTSCGIAFLEKFPGPKLNERSGPVTSDFLIFCQMGGSSRITKAKPNKEFEEMPDSSLSWLPSKARAGLVKWG